jgi:hypothetical protein
VKASIEKKIDNVVEEAMVFADASQLSPQRKLLETVFTDPEGFGIRPDQFSFSQPTFLKSRRKLELFIEQDIPVFS